MNHQYFHQACHLNAHQVWYQDGYQEIAGTYANLYKTSLNPGSEILVRFAFATDLLASVLQ